MGKNSTVIQVRLDAEISELQSKLKLVGQDLDRFGNGETTQNLQNQFKQLETTLNEIQSTAKEPVGEKSMTELLSRTKEVGTGIDNLASDFKALKKLTNSEKLEIMSPEAKARMEAIRSTMSEYESSISNVKSKQNELNSAQKEQKAIEEQINKNQKTKEANLKKIAQLSKDQVSISKKLEAAENDPKQKIKSKGGELNGRTRKGKAVTQELQAQEALYKSNQQAIQRYTDENKELETNLNSLQSRQKEVEKNIRTLNGEFEQGVSTTNMQANAYNKLYTEARSLGVSVDDLSQEFSDSNAQELLSRLRALENQGFDKLDNSIDENVSSLNQCANAQKNLENKVDNTNRELQEQDRMMENVSTLQGRISQYVGMEGIINALTQSLRAAFETVKELDASMTEMAVVTEDDIGSYWEKLPDYTRRASELGLVINDVYQADMLYYQQGLKTNEVIAVSAETMKMAKIAGLETADATDRMTAALRGFNMEINQASAQRIADVYSELAAITASDVDEISTAMTKTASIASSAGMEFETTAAFLSQIIETTREAAETAGTALKTVIARFQELKKDPSEIGEVDGEIVDANKIETALRSVGVALRDSSGQFRELDDVFLELASKWDSLDKNTQRYIATIAAGSRQQSRFIAMMSDYSRTQELVAAANNSAGASAQQYEKTLESLQTKLNKLKNAWDTFTMGIMDNDIIKTGIDILTALLNVINKVFEFLDNIPLVGFAARIGLVVGGLMLLDKITHNFFVSLQNGQSILTSAGAALRGYALNTEGARIAMDKSTLASQRAAVVTAFSATSESGYINVLSMKEKTLYETLVAQHLSQKLSEEEAKEKAKMIILEQAYVATLNAEEREQYDNIKAALVAEGASEDEAAAKAKVIMATNSEAQAEESNEKVKKKSLWTTFASIFATQKDAIAKLFGAGATMTLVIATSLLVLEVLALIAVIVLVVIAIVALCNSFDQADKNAQKTAKAAEEAGQAAEEAEEKFNNLSETLDGLQEKYKAFEDLRKGTEEWNKSIKEINKSVLELIQEYPELAGLVENEGGVLKLEVNSDAVQDVLDQYEARASIARGAATGMQIEASKATQQADFANLEATKKVGNRRGWKAAGLHWGSVGAIKAGIEARKAGEGWGETIGMALIGQTAAGILAKNNTEMDENLEKATQELAKAYLEKGLMSQEEMEEFLKSQGVVASEARVMAKEFAKDTDALKEFGESTLAAEAQQKAYYQAMATQAQSMIDLSKYTQEQMNQMSTVVDSDKVKEYEEKLKEDYSDDDSEETEAALKKYMESLEGVDRVEKIKDGKIVYIDKDGKKQKVDKEVYIKQMIAAEATEMAAGAMEHIPSSIDKTMDIIRNAGNDTREALEAGAKAIDKAFSDPESLTLGELNSMKDAMGEDYANIKSAWTELSDEEKAAYGSPEAFLKEFTDIVKSTEEAFEKARETADKLDITLSDKLSSAAAQAWTTNLSEITRNGSEATGLNEALNSLVDGLSVEDTNAIMAQINALDMMNITDWEELEYTFKDLGIDVASNELQKFIQAGIETAGAIRKIDFSNFNTQINDTYKLLNKVKEGGRTYSEEDYKELIAANRGLKDDFTQIGDEFIYVGGSMSELTAALEKNTVAVLEEAKSQLKNQIDIANIVKSEADNREYGQTQFMNRIDLINYLKTMRDSISTKGEDIGSLGIKGLSSNTAFWKASKEQLQEWAEEIEAMPAKLSLLNEDYAKVLEEAAIQQYIHKDAYENAELASVLDSEDAYQRQEALILQAIQSGAVTDSMIESYRKAIEEKDRDAVKELGQKIAKSTKLIVESNEGRDSYADLVERVKEAMVEVAQKEIDKLSELNDSVNSANEALVSKIEQQIDEARQERDNKEMEQNLTDLYNQRAWLSMQTSGSSTELLSLDQQISEAEKDYEDTLIDQALQNLSDANERAAEQRERQIAIMENQLQYEQETGQLTLEAEAIVAESLQDIKNGTTALETAMGKLLWGAEGGNQSLDKITAENWAQDLQQAATKAANWFDTNSDDGSSEGSAGGASGSSGLTSEEASQQSALSDVDTALSSANNKRGGMKNSTTQDALSKAKTKFVNEGKGTEEEFDKYVQDRMGERGTEITGGSIDGVEVSGLNDGGGYWGTYDEMTVKMDNGSYKIFIGHTDGGGFAGKTRVADDATAKALNEIVGGDPESGWIAMYDRTPYMYIGRNRKKWYQMTHDGDEGDGAEFATDYLKKLQQFKTGGLADFTGPAWLDGTKSRPEYVLNADQTKKFFSLIDVLERYDEKSSSSKSGDNYFDIAINVEKLENDYDVEQVADKIRRMIYEDAAYRNVNAINHIR